MRRTSACFRLVAVVVLSLALSCSFEKPQAPSWDVDINIPLTNRTITMNEIVEDHSHIFARNDGLLGLSIIGEMDTTRIGDYLDVPTFVHDAQLNVPNLHFPRLHLGDAAFYMHQIHADVKNYYNSYHTVPAFCFCDVPCSNPNWTVERCGSPWTTVCRLI